MCGRITFHVTSMELRDRFGAVRGLDAIKDWSPRYNVGPTSSVVCLRGSADGRELFAARWGLIPAGTTGVKPTGSFNAKSEKILTDPMFQEAFKRRRCVVIASGFYEWRFHSPTDSQAYYISLRSGEPIAMAGLWESWQPPEGEMIETCTICTTTANSMMERIHDRMPVILPCAILDRWLDPANDNASALTPILAQLPSDDLQAWPVRKDVGNVRNQGAYLTKPIM